MARFLLIGILTLGVSTLLIIEGMSEANGNGLSLEGWIGVGVMSVGMLFIFLAVWLDWNTQRQITPREAQGKRNEHDDGLSLLSASAQEVSLGVFDVHANDDRWYATQRQSTYLIAMIVVVCLGMGILLGVSGFSSHKWSDVGVGLFLVGLAAWAMVMMVRTIRIRLDSVEIDAQGLALHFRNKSVRRLHWTSHEVRLTMFDYRERTLSDYQGFSRVPCRIGMGYGLVSNGISAKAFDAIVQTARASGVKVTEKHRSGGREVHIGM